uniref:Uncharacterized protein n=1 Tax=Anguilla anguilla TaxID=7936 RepID=A0A0E9QH81_ANGAN
MDQGSIPIILCVCERMKKTISSIA